MQDLYWDAVLVPTTIINPEFRTTTQGRPNCGGQTYHERRTGVEVQGQQCSNHTVASSCNLISTIHPEGILMCLKGKDVVAVEYFTGLDKKICEFAI